MHFGGAEIGTLKYIVKKKKHYFGWFGVLRSAYKTTKKKHDLKLEILFLNQQASAQSMLEPQLRSNHIYRRINVLYFEK